ncbi:hypothetical protein BGZ89_009118 [Linnemannia elongata]|nr:hypothetical protein BGZ89_009118 [Linnemannia elongata]
MLQADGVAPQEPQLVQAVRSVNKDQAPSSIAPAQSDDIFYVDCHTDPGTQKPVVLWDDILQALEPRRIAAVPNTVLDVVVGNPSLETKVASSLPGSMQEKEEETKPVKNVVGSQGTPASSTSTIRQSPVYGVENTVLDNYNHIDRPPSSQCATTDSSARRNPVWGLENTAMDNYSHIDHPAFAPPPRGPQTLLDNQTPTIEGLPALLHASIGRELSSRAPQSESATTNALKERDLVQLGISASQGDKDAQVALGDMYREGEGVQQDYQAAMDWYLKAANQEDSIGQRRVGFLYYGGLGVSQSHSTALEWFIKAANQGDPGAQKNIGVMYNKGRGVPQEFSKAMEWFRKAADQGYAAAQNSIGLMYDEGKGVPQDFVKAMEWFLKAAVKGDSNAQNSIGNMYDKGKGVPQDFAKAVEWLRMAADQGHTYAQNNIGCHYRKGGGVSQDYFQAMKWFCKAADQGNAEAQYNVGAMYNYGEGVTKNDSEARKWFQKAADQGNSLIAISFTFPNTQGIRSINNLTSSPTLLFEVVNVDIYTDRVTEDKFMLREDIRHNAPHIPDKARMVPFMKGDDFNTFVYGLTAAPSTHMGSIPKAQHNSGKTSIDQPSSDDNEPRLPKEISPLTNEVSALADISLPTKPVASQSDIDAQVTLGYNYMDSQNYQAAIKCYLKAANQGHPVGQRYVGAMHHSSESVTQYYSIAIWWYLKSVDQGDAEAYLNIRTLYKHGHGVPQDFSRAMNWYQDAANHGLAEGQYVPLRTKYG